MSKTIAIPRLNALSYTLFTGATYDSVTDSITNVGTLKNSLFGNTIHISEQQLTFCQKVETADELNAIYAIVTGPREYNPITAANIYDHSGALVANIPLLESGTYTDYELVEWTYYLVRQYLNALEIGGSEVVLPDGIYYLGIHYTDDTLSGAADLFLSEPIYVQAEHKDTILMRWLNDTNDFDILFSELPAGWAFSQRFDGGFESEGYSPKVLDEIYMDIIQNPVLLSSKPYDTKKVTYGRARGIPNYQASIVNRIWACTNVYIDDLRHCKVPGAKLEPTRTKFYPLAGWRVEVMESFENWSQYRYRVEKILGYGKYAFRGIDLIRA